MGVDVELVLVHIGVWIGGCGFGVRAKGATRCWKRWRLSAGWPQCWQAGPWAIKQASCTAAPQRRLADDEARARPSKRHA